MDLVTAALMVRLLIEAFPKLAAAWAEYTAIKNPTTEDWDKIWAINKGRTYDEIVHAMTGISGARPGPALAPAPRESKVTVAQLAEVRQESEALKAKTEDVATAATVADQAAQALDAKIQRP